MGSYSNNPIYEEIMHYTDMDEIQSNFIGDPMDPVWGDILGDMSSTPGPVRVRRAKDAYAQQDYVKEMNRQNAQNSRDAKKQLDRLRAQETAELLVELEELKAFKAVTVDFMSNNGMDAKFLTLMELLRGDDTGL